jgi:uncharacterized protein (TIGR00266 family)
MRNTHEIDFEIIGEEMQCVQIELDPQETVVAEPGSLMHMDGTVQMETIFGDGSKKSAGGGFLNSLFSAGKRILTGESLFMTAFTNTGLTKSHVTFASPFPGKIIPMDLSEYDNKIICQKDAFLCSAKGNSIGIEFQRKLAVGLFGGEGFIMQKIEGDGLAFLHTGGTVVRRDLKEGELLMVDTGCLVAFTQKVDYDIQVVKGLKNAFLGGEGLFLTTLTGPGTVWIQSLPFSRLANRIISSIPRSGKSRDEGSILGGLGDLIDGDNRF